MNWNRPLQQWLAQFDFSDLKNWIIPLLIVGGPILGSITKAIRDRTEKKKNQEKKALEPPAPPARPVNRDIPVARARPGSLPGPQARSSPAPYETRPKQTVRRTARPLPQRRQPDRSSAPVPPKPKTPVARRSPDAPEAPRPVASFPWDVLAEGLGFPVPPRGTGDADHEPPEAATPTPPQSVTMPDTGASHAPKRVSKQRQKSPTKRQTGTTRIVHSIQADTAKEPVDPFAVSLPSSDPHAVKSVTDGDTDDLALIRRPTRAALRRAIIMNEILAPPIALREPDNRV